MPNYFQIPLYTAKLWPGHDSGIHKHTHTDRVNSICPSAISWRGIKMGMAAVGRDKSGHVQQHESKSESANDTIIAEIIMM